MPVKPETMRHKQTQHLSALSLLLGCLLLLCTTLFCFPNTWYKRWDTIKNTFHAWLQQGRSAPDIYVTGHVLSDKNNIQNILSTLKGTQNTHALHAAREAIQALPWVKSVILRYTWTHQLTCIITETEPVARLATNKEGTFIYVDKDSHLINPSNHAQEAPHLLSLPILTGRKAHKHFPALHKKIHTIYPPLLKHLKHLEWMPAERWNITLLQGTLVQLPDTKNLNKALQHLAQHPLLRFEGLAVYDLRNFPYIRFIRKTHGAKTMQHKTMNF